MIRRRQIPDGLRERVFSQTGHACYYCGAYATEIDHAVPHSYSQDDSERNLVPACWICNKIAGNRHFDTLGAKRGFILSERDSVKWKRKIASMERTIIVVTEAPMSDESKSSRTEERKPAESVDAPEPAFVRRLPNKPPAKQKREARKKTNPPQIDYRAIIERESENELDEFINTIDDFDFLSQEAFDEISAIASRSYKTYTLNLLLAGLLAANKLQVRA